MVVKLAPDTPMVLYLSRTRADGTGIEQWFPADRVDPNDPKIVGRATQQWITDNPGQRPPDALYSSESLQNLRLADQLDDQWNSSEKTQADADRYLLGLRSLVTTGQFSNDAFRQIEENVHTTLAMPPYLREFFRAGGSAGGGATDTTRDPALAALQQELAGLRQELKALMAEEQADTQINTKAIQSSVPSPLQSTIRGETGGELLKSPIGGLFGTEGVTVGPALASLSRGEVLGQPGSLLSAIGIRPPSAQALSRMTPLEFNELGKLTELAGIPQSSLLSELSQAVPGGRRSTTFARQPNAVRLF